jgi:hypothetical protein
MDRLVGESGWNVLGFLGLGDYQPVIEKQIEKVSKDGNQGYMMQQTP